MKVSIFLPTIRPYLLEKWYDSLEKSCNKHSFEVIFCGPYDIPHTLRRKNNVKFIKDFGSPTRAGQIAAINANGDYLYHTTDDVLFFPNVISDELDSIQGNEIVGMRYREGQNYSGNTLDNTYWYSPNAYPNLRGVNNTWGICVHFLMCNKIFIKYGGFDCRWQYLNHAGHDLLFRIQQNENIKYILSKNEICSADWTPGTMGDHGPVHFAQTEDDAPLFIQEWCVKNTRKCVPLNNYQNQPEIWKRRFPNKVYE